MTRIVGLARFFEVHQYFITHAYLTESDMKLPGDLLYASKS